MKKKQTGLGRGLSALIDDAALAEASGEIRSLPLHKIEPNPLQPRREFDLELALVENLQREDLNPMEEAAGFQTLMDEYGLTQETIAERVGRSRSAVANSLRLLSLSDELAALVRSGTLSAGHARALLSLKDEKLRRQAAQRIMALQLSVRQAETLCRNLGKPKQKPAEQPLTVDYIAECEKTLSRHLGRKVKIVNGKRKGRFELEFYGPEDLNRLLFALQKTPIKEETKDG